MVALHLMSKSTASGEQRAMLPNDRTSGGAMAASESMWGGNSGGEVGVTWLAPPTDAFTPLVTGDTLLR